MDQGASEIFFQLKPDAIKNNLKMYLQLVAQRQQQQINTQILDEVERFVNALDSFINEHVTCFAGVCPKETLMTKIYGKVEESAAGRHIYLRPEQFRQLCNDRGFERDSLLPKLHEQGLFLPFTDKQTKKPVPYGSKKINNADGKAYHFLLPKGEDDDTNEPTK